MANTKLNLYQKLIEVRKKCPYLQKDGFNDHFKYSYISSTTIIGSLKSALDEMGILLVPSIKDVTVTHIQNAKGNPEIFTQVFMEFTWINSENSEQTLTVPFYSQGIDSSERGIGKALTYAEKNFLLKSFNIPSDNYDPDSFNKKLEKSLGTGNDSRETDQDVPEAENNETTVSPCEFGLPDGIGISVRIKDGFASIVERQKGLTYKYRNLLTQAGFTLHPTKKIYYKKIQ